MKRKINKNGGLTLPKAERVAAGIFPGMAVEITATAPGSVSVRTVHRSCLLCGSMADVLQVGSVDICQRCAEQLREVLDEQE